MLKIQGQTISSNKYLHNSLQTNEFTFYASKSHKYHWMEWLLATLVKAWILSWLHEKKKQKKEKMRS